MLIFKRGGDRLTGGPGARTAGARMLCKHAKHSGIVSHVVQWLTSTVVDKKIFSLAKIAIHFCFSFNISFNYVGKFVGKDCQD